MKTKTEKVKTPLFLFLFLIGLVANTNVSHGARSATFASIVEQILDFLGVFPRFIIALAFVYFIYGLLQFVTSLDEKKRTEARYTIGYGLLGIFVMVSVWGIVEFVRNLIGI